MDELERRLRDSLQARSQDVEATPDLWLDVQERRGRKRRLRWVTIAGMAAAAAVVAVVAVPAALDTLRTGGGDLVVAPGPDTTATPSPALTPTGPPPTPTTGPPTAAPEELDTDLPGTPLGGLATDGRRIFSFGNGGVTGDTLYTFPAEGESSVVAMTVRPGSTADDLTAVLLTEAEGTYDLRWLERDGDQVTVQPFPESHGLENDAIGGSVPAPVWSPDGRHLIWAEDGEEGEPGLRAIGWSDGPGTGRDADDNTEFGAPVLPRGATVRLEDWVWTGGTGTETRGYVTATSVDPGDLTAWRIGIERQGDGALALSNTMGTIPFGEDAVVDHADSHAHDGTGAGPAYLLTVGEPGEGHLGLELTWSAAGDRGGSLPVPAEVNRGSDVSSIWMTARGGGVVLGKGGRAWIVTIAGDVRPVEGPVTHAELVP